MDKDIVHVDTVEGARVEGTMQLRRLIHGQQELRLEIDGVASIIQAGDVWLHPQKTLRNTHALENAVWLKFRTTAQEPFTLTHTH